MFLEPTNSTLNFLDSPVNKSIDFIASTIRQLIQLIFCLVSIMVVGKLINFFMVKAPQPEPEAEVLNAEVEGEAEPEVFEEAKEPSGWDSESIVDPPTPSLEVPSKKVSTKTMKKQFKRKCMSVGPIMLTPTSQIVRSLNVEEGEERYRYDILPLDRSATTDMADAAAVADNVCVPCDFVCL